MATYISINSILALAFLSALVGFGFKLMLEPDMIFGKYNDYLNYLANKEFKTIHYRLFEFKLWYNTIVIITFYRIKLPYFNLSNSHYFRCGKHISHSRSKFLYYITKPLGRCIICNTTWIGIILSLLILDMQFEFKILSTICVGCASAALVTIITVIHKRLISI
ncbi:MAG: hypothetical protein M0R17_08085 [Candidatus Omnitrophica bacterium]|jgi:hypothetical protein|nr:hypothetical protein [Candidatus Omnitrophota bacterium]